MLSLGMACRSSFSSTQGRLQRSRVGLECVSLLFQLPALSLQLPQGLVSAIGKCGVGQTQGQGGFLVAQSAAAARRGGVAGGGSRVPGGCAGASASRAMALPLSNHSAERCTAAASLLRCSPSDSARCSRSVSVPCRNCCCSASGR